MLSLIAEIPLELQGKLLRVMQEKTFVPVGDSWPMTVDVRGISATNKILPPSRWRRVASGWT